MPKANNNQVSGGFPHSEIPGSKLILSSPGLIAEYHVLHRLLLPRHPPNALIALDLIRKKKDLNLAVPATFCARGNPSSDQNALVLFPHHFLPRGAPAQCWTLLCSKSCFWLVYLTWTTSSLASLPGSRRSTYAAAIDDADYLSERCKGFRRTRVRQDEQTLTRKAC